MRAAYLPHRSLRPRRDPSRVLSPRRDGFPHVVAMGFLAKDGAIYMTSYAKEPRPEPGALARASKRVVLRVTPEKVASWDHRKLGGLY